MSCMWIQGLRASMVCAWNRYGKGGVSGPPDYRAPPRPPGGRDGDGVERDENELIDWPFVHWGLGPRLRCHMDLILGCLDPVTKYYFA